MLNISKELYFGYANNSVSNLPEAEVIPGGKSSNEKRKLQTLTKKYPNIVEHENIPLPGFTLHKVNRKHWGSTEPSWLVIDPRGFLARISSLNLENILHFTGITEGLIQERCVWARENSETKMSLIPISHPVYQEAIKNTELIENKVKIKDVQIGDKVLLQNKKEGIYMGCASLYGPVTESYGDRKEYAVSPYIKRQIIKLADKRYYYQTDAKILAITEKTDSPLTLDEAVLSMNEDIATGKCIFTQYQFFNPVYYTAGTKIDYVSKFAEKSVILKLEEITKEEAIELFDASNSHNITGNVGNIVLEDFYGYKYLVDFKYLLTVSMRAQQKTTTDSFDVFSIDIQNVNDGVSLVYRSNDFERFSIDNLKKFYKIVKHVKDETYV